MVVGERGEQIMSCTNRVTIIDKNNNLTNFKLKLKKDAAMDIINKIAEIIKE